MTKPRLLIGEEALKIERIFLEIQALIGRASVGRREILQAIGDLSKKGIGNLIARLHELKKTTEERAAENTSEIVSTAQAAHQFSTQGLPSFMGDFYDSEVRAVHIWACRTLSGIDQMIAAITEISGMPVDSCTSQAATETSPAYFWPD